MRRSQARLAFGIAFAVYCVAFFSLTLPPYEHHDGFVTLARVGCNAFNWFDYQSGRPLFAVAQCLASIALDGNLGRAIAMRALACLTMAACTGLFAGFLVRRGLPAFAAVVASSAIFALPGAVLLFLMLQSTLVAPTVVVSLLAGMFWAEQPSVRRGIFAMAAVFVMLLWYQPYAVLFFLPVLAALLTDLESPPARQIRLACGAAAIFAGASLAYYAFVPVLTHFAPPAGEMYNHAVEVVAPNPLRRMRWILGRQLEQMSLLWYPFASLFALQFVVFGALVAGSIVALAARMVRPVVATVSAVALIALTDLPAFLVRVPETLIIERVKWPVQAALLIPPMLLLAQSLRRPAIRFAAAALLIFVALVPVQTSMIEGRVVADLSEIEFMRQEILRQIALKKESRFIVVIGRHRNTDALTFGHQLTDELFTPTSFNALSLWGMTTSVFRALGLPPTSIRLVDWDTDCRDALKAQDEAKANNAIVVDFRRYPAVTLPASLQNEACAVPR